MYKNSDGDNLAVNITREHSGIKTTIDKTFNLLENNCGIIEEKDIDVIVKIQNNIQNEQSILLIGQGRKENNKYGNLKVIVKVK